MLIDVEKDELDLLVTSLYNLPPQRGKDWDLWSALVTKLKKLQNANKGRPRKFA